MNSKETLFRSCHDFWGEVKPPQTPWMWGFLAGVLLCALLQVVPAHALWLKDQTGRMVALPDKARRIVSLAPNITEMIFSLGAGGNVVGCCQHSNFPPETSLLPRVGSYYRPDLERIVALRPDLCLAVRDGTPSAVLNRLEQMGIPVFILNPQSLEGVREALLLAGTALDRQEEATHLVTVMDERLGHLDAAVARYVETNGGRPTVLVRIQANPFMAAARGTYPAELVERCGGNIPLRGGILYPPLSQEDLLLLKPDVIIAPAGGKMQPLAAQSGRSSALVYGVSEDLMFRPSLRSLDAMDMIIALLWQQDSSVTLRQRGI